MKKHDAFSIALLVGFFGVLTGCEPREQEQEENFLQVIGEYEQSAPEAGYRLNLSYNGPISQREKFIKWADSLQQKVPSMVKTNEGIFLNYMPEQMGKKISRDMYQASVTYQLTISDSTLYRKITEDLIQKNIPFNLNVMGTFTDPARKEQVQHQMMQKALDNARSKLDFMSSNGREYEIVEIEELDNTTPYGPEYYDFNRRMLVRLKVKARLL